MRSGRQARLLTGYLHTTAELKRTWPVEERPKKGAEAKVHSLELLPLYRECVPLPCLLARPAYARDWGVNVASHAHPSRYGPLLAHRVMPLL